MPIAANSKLVSRAAVQFHRVCTRRHVEWQVPACEVVCPTRFNRITDETGSKGAVLGRAFVELVGRLASLIAEPCTFFIDKHGGRNSYAALVQTALPGRMVVTTEESAERSTYHAVAPPADARFIFCPRADEDHFCVALASMVSKYVRELLMLEFNRFWASHVPGLKPTAGYPSDASRFYEAIRPAASTLGIPESALWRCK
jgi:hypothetical protein